jgi:hypothetical protein
MQLLTLLLTLAQIPPVDGNSVDFIRMRYTEILAGTGEAAKPGQEYTVHYTGWLTDGKKFDSSRDRNDPLKFIQGRRRVIAGWEAGFEGMKVGGKRRLFIPYQMAYGEAGRGAIPPKAELIFDVELLGAKDVPAAVAGLDLLNSFEEYSQKMLTLAGGRELSKGASETVWQTTQMIKLLLWMANDNPPEDLARQRFADAAKKASPAATKEEALNLLREQVEAARKALPALRAAQLDREMVVFGQPSTMRGIYLTLIARLAENYGRLSAEP